MACPDWIELLIDKEIQSSSGACIQKTILGRPSLLIGDLKQIDEVTWTSTEYVPPGCAGQAIINDFLHWDEFQPLHEQVLLWNLKGINPELIVFTGA